MELREEGNCFVCGRENSQGLGASFVLDPERGRAECRLTIPARFQGWEQVVHGGILATLLDEAGIYACRCFGQHFVTAELAVKYRRPVPVETEVTVAAEVVKRRRRIFTVLARILDGDTVCAEAEGKIFQIESA